MRNSRRVDQFCKLRRVSVRRHVFVSLFDVDEFSRKNEVGVGWNLGRRSAGTIAEIGRDSELSLLSVIVNRDSTITL